LTEARALLRNSRIGFRRKTDMIDIKTCRLTIRNFVIDDWNY
jgi:hypothetical protein